MDWEQKVKRLCMVAGQENHGFRDNLEDVDDGNSKVIRSWACSSERRGEAKGEHILVLQKK